MLIDNSDSYRKDQTKCISDRQKSPRIHSTMSVQLIQTNNKAYTVLLPQIHN